MNVQEEHYKNYPDSKPKITTQSDLKLQNYMTKVQSEDINSVYTNTDQIPERIDAAGITLSTKNEEPEETIEKKVYVLIFDVLLL